MTQVSKLEGIQVSEVVTASPQEIRSTEVLGRVAGLVGEKKFAEVFALIDHAVTADPQNGDLLNAQGYVFTAMGNHAEALKWYRNALKLSPKAAGIWNNLGTAFTRLKYFKAAIACHQRAISLSGDEAFAHHNLGLAYSEAGLHGEAIAAFTRALDLDHRFHLARWDRARSYLFLGNYELGWADYEVRLTTGQVPKRAIQAAKWDGRPYAGKRLVLLAEQGFGDTIWVLRYLKQVKALGGELFVECQPALVSLVAWMQIADRVIPLGEIIPETDLYCHLCSLPSFLFRDFSLFPGQAYISPPQGPSRKLRPLLERAGQNLKVGIVWSGSVTFDRNESRALPLQRLLQAIDFPNVQLYSLQKGPPEKELAALNHDQSVIDLSPELEDFSYTAAAVSQLDLIIMTDSAVAHLAGALGKPVWVLLGHAAHWLWLLNREDSPWYPSMRLFRPRVEGDWDYVLDKVAVELMALTSALGPDPTQNSGELDL